jgi:predicted DNA-binding WGR domain protein
MRRFEFTDDKSAKFWEIEQSDSDLNIRWGRIGTAGQSQTKNFADAAKASAAMLKLITEKTTKGYAELATTAGASIGTTPAKPPAAKSTPSKPAAAPSDDTAASETASPAAIKAAPVESMDQQIERAFEAIRAQIADAKVPLTDPLTSAKIRRTHGISELAAGHAHKLLASAGLIAHWDSLPTVKSKNIAIQLASGQASMQAPTEPSVETPSGLAPWLAQGEPLRLGGAADNTRQLARATRRNPKPVELVDPLRHWQLVAAMTDGMEPDFANSDAGLRAAFEAAWQNLNSPKLSGTPQTDAILMVLCLNRRRYQNSQGGIDMKFIDYLVARHGLPYVVDTLLEAMLYNIEEKFVWHGSNYKNGTAKVRVYYHAQAAASDFQFSVFNEGQWHLRTHLAAAPQDIYDACAAKVRKGMSGVDPERQVALALLFPDLPEMTHELIDQMCASGVKTPPSLHWLQLNATDPAALAQARKIKFDGYSNFWSQAEMASTILLEHGIDAVRWLAPGAAHEQAGDVLTRIGTPESLDALARAASSGKPALARLGLAVERWPAAAMFALARLLSGTSKDQSLLMPTLVDLVRSQPELPTQLRPWLEPSGNALLETLRARLAGPTDVAGAEELPEVLASVPWLQAKKKAAQVLQLQALPLAAVEHWDAGEKETIQNQNSWQMSRFQEAMRSPNGAAEQFGFDGKKHQAERKAARDAIAQGKAPELVAAWRSMLAERKKDRYFYYYFHGVAAASLPPALAIPFWNAAASEASCTGVDFVAATLGLPAFPGILARIGSAPTENLGVAMHFGVVELGPIAARAFAKLKSLRGQGRAWLKRFPEHAACALIAPALGKPNEARDCAASALRYLASIGHAALLDQVAARYGQPEVLTALHAVLNESPLDRYPNKRAALPDFWKPNGWSRPLLHNGKALPDAALDVLGTMMAFPTTEEVYAGLHQVKAACTAQSLADFAWDCFSAWLNASAPSKEGWALLNLGLFGTDDTARKLTPFIRAWPGEAAHARAVTGLDVLAAIGSDVSLMLLNGIAQKVKFKGLQDKAGEKIDAIAEARGLTAEELEDRLAPDLGLDEQGSMVLDFGPRAYKVGFDESLKPYVREWQDDKAGARLPDLPKPKKTDDEVLAKEATERFKLLKKDARTIASQQVLRLELAMCARRRWSAEVFAQFIANHPLVRHLVRRLVWGVYAMPTETVGEGEDAESRVASYGGELQDCFRVSEDGQYTTAGDDPFALPEGEQYKIGLPHALELPADQAADFGQLLADYELLQPFAQLGRDTYTLDEQERAADKLLRWKDVKVATGKVLGLSNIGWRRGEAQDGGCIWTYDKAADARRTLELTLDPGIIVGMIDEYPEQTLGEITLGSGYRWGSNPALSTFGTLDPIVASELIRDMERLRS